MSGKNMTLLLFILFSDCASYKTDHHWDTRNNIKVTLNLTDWKECRDLCSEWLGKKNELCEFWQWLRGRANRVICTFKKGTSSTCGQPDRANATGQFSGRCVPPSGNTCDDGTRYGESMTQTYQIEF